MLLHISLSTLNIDNLNPIQQHEGWGLKVAMPCEKLKSVFGEMDYNTIYSNCF